jgi:hypothetical protein
MTLVAITIALAGWFLYRFSQPPALQAAEAFQTDPVNFSSVPPTAKPHVQEKQESGLFVVLLAVILIALSVVGADWFFKIGLVPWAR